MTTPPAHRGTISAWVDAVRLRHWPKNLLVFVVPFAAHDPGSATLIAAGLALLAFGLTASAGYLLNDLLDRTGDASHPRKSARAIAAGAVSAGAARTAIAVLVAGALAIAALLPWKFALCLGVYFAGVALYSARLKHRKGWDVAALACFYGLRVLAGGAATAIFVSPWLIAYALGLFGALALAKRLGELTAGAPGRPYGPADRKTLRALGAIAALLSVAVLALYINAPDVHALYPNPSLLYVICLVQALWLAWLLRLADSARLPDDPVLFALRDPLSLAGAGLALVAFTMASLP